MASGKYDTRVQVQTKATTKDDFGQKVRRWVNSGTPLWAELNYGSGNERRVGAAQEQANLPVTVTVRHSTFSKTIKAIDTRLEFNGLQWDIESVAPGTGKNRNREIVIVARAQI